MNKRMKARFKCCYHHDYSQYHHLHHHLAPQKAQQLIYAFQIHCVCPFQIFIDISIIIFNRSSSSSNTSSGKVSSILALILIGLNADCAFSLLDKDCYCFSSNVCIFLVRVPER